MMVVMDPLVQKRREHQWETAQNIPKPTENFKSAFFEMSELMYKNHRPEERQ